MIYLANKRISWVRFQNWVTSIYRNRGSNFTQCYLEIFQILVTEIGGGSLQRGSLQEISFYFFILH